MSLRLRSLALCAVLLLAAGCGTYRSYRLPVSPRQARSMRAPLVSVAQSMGYRTTDFDHDSVNVFLNDTTRVGYMVQNDEYNMVITVDEKDLPAGQKEQRVQAAKAKGDEIWARAIEARNMNAPPPRGYGY